METARAESSGLGSAIHSETLWSQTLWSRLFSARKGRGNGGGMGGRNRVSDAEPSGQEALVYSWAEEGASKKF